MLTISDLEPSLLSRSLEVSLFDVRKPASFACQDLRSEFAFDVSKLEECVQGIHQILTHGQSCVGGIWDAT